MKRFIGAMLCVAFVLSVIGCSPSGGTKFVPVSSASSSANFIHVPADFSRIQEAVDASVPNDVIVISGGWYQEDIVLKDGVELRGDPTATHLQGTIFANCVGAKVYGLQVDNPQDVVEVVGGVVAFDHCTLKAGVARLFDSASVTFRNCTFDGTWGGVGAIRVSSGYAKIERSIFENWQWALDSLLAPTVAAGEFQETVFWNNFVDTRGHWSGTPIIGNPLHTSPSYEYYLDNGSSAIFASGEYAGAWRPAEFKVRPKVSVLSLVSTALNPSTTATTVLDFKISVTGADPNTFVEIDFLEFDLVSSVIVNTPVEWRLREGPTLLANPQFGIYPNGVYYLGLPRLIVASGQTKRLSLDIDLSAFFMSGDSIELVLRSIRWSDGGRISNNNGQNIGLPSGGVSSGALVVP